MKRAKIIIDQKSYEHRNLDSLVLTLACIESHSL